MDIVALANLFNINVYVYTYNVQSWDLYGYRAPNRWTVTSPDPLLSSFNPIIPGEVMDLVLYQEDEAHYDLLVREDSRLAVKGTVPMRIRSISNTSNEQESGTDYIGVSSPCPTLPSPSAPLSSCPTFKRKQFMESQGISPMNFPPCPRGRGRPKLKERQGAPATKSRGQKRKATNTGESGFTSLPDLFNPYLID